MASHKGDKGQRTYLNSHYGHTRQKAREKVLLLLLIGRESDERFRKQITKRTDAKANLEFFSTLKGKTHYTILEIQPPYTGLSLGS